ncbi:hypothetical protein OSB04_021015 [Centaurea solstitialis]|uniref:Calcium-transporting ATPase n=1 Tax=Centaurea solstitialis TaxID=347529 RepID=A0AA38TBV0_9ASTR|nr:hypothetical protein OSB04_021015 [Centaurea solstitialis]
MSSGGSPYRRQRKDVESGGGGSGGFQDDNGSVCDPFDIVSTKSASVDRLKRWRHCLIGDGCLLFYESPELLWTVFRCIKSLAVFCSAIGVNRYDILEKGGRKQAALVLNASRRFRYTLDLKKEEEKKQIIAKIRTHAQVIRAAYRFQAAAVSESDGTQKAPPAPIPTGDYNVSPEQLASMTRDHDFSALQNFGGRFVFDACRDTTLIILMVAAAASLALGIKTEGIKEGWYDGGSIALAVMIVIVVTAISDYKQSLQFQNLNEEKQNIQLEVIRGGRRVNISIFDIVVGDVIPLKIGDQVHKDHKSPFLMSGCKVADGYGTMLEIDGDPFDLVISRNSLKPLALEINTEWGLLMASISEDNGEETPLQVRLNGVATFIGIVGLLVAVFVLAILLIRFFTGHTRDAERRVEFIAGKTSVGDAVDGAIKIFTVAVTIVVVAVPEGLPLAVTLTLAYSMRKMMADKALVRRLSACETMGSATTICSDKTGTLTLNKMTVVEAYICGKKVDPPSSKSELPSRAVSLIIESVAQNTTGSVFLPEGGSEVELSGSPTEKAILQWGVKLGMNFEAVRSESSIIHAFPFNSEKKRGGVAVKLPDNEVNVHWKGAAEIVLAACTRYMDDNEQLVALDEAKVEYFKKAIEDMAAGSLRCVAIAYRPCKGETVPTDEDELAQWELPEGDLVLLAIVGLKDPCRPGVREAVELCIKAGVKVRMVTGDNLQTARAIALECGILGSNADATEPNLIEGKSFRALTEEQRLEVADKISVMGRSSPNDKLLLVQALRKRGHVVAADIGLAMGIQGTEVAKESSDIIILDDNFASVVKVVRWGRSVYANIQKFIQFQLTVNVAALIINVVAAVSSGDVPLNAVQLLWVNLIMDTLGALALATEPPTDHLMDRHPVGRREPLITNIMWRNLLIQAFYQVSVLLVLNFRGRELLHSQHDPAEHAIKEKNTLIFNAFVLAQVFNEFNARKPDEMNVFKGVTKNRLFMGIVGLTVVLQVLIIMFLGKFTTTVRLSWQLWLVSIVIGLISWPLAVVGKFIPVSEKPFSEYFTDIFASCTRRRNRGGNEDDS